MRASIPNLPVSSKMQMPSNGNSPSIKDAMRSKPLQMSGGVTKDIIGDKNTKSGSPTSRLIAGAKGKGMGC